MPAKNKKSLITLKIIRQPFYIIALIPMLACSINMKNTVHEYELSGRVKLFYEYIEEKQYSKIYDFFDKDVIASKEEVANEFNRYNFKISLKEINKISIWDNKAIVNVTICFTEHRKAIFLNKSDKWIFKNGKWRMVLFGKQKEEDSIKRFRYPEDYRREQKDESK